MNDMTLSRRQFVVTSLTAAGGFPGELNNGWRAKGLDSFDAEIPIVRPLLDTWREETLLYCAEHGLRPHVIVIDLMLPRISGALVLRIGFEERLVFLHRLGELLARLEV